MPEDLPVFSPVQFNTFGRKKGEGLRDKHQRFYEFRNSLDLIKAVRASDINQFLLRCTIKKLVSNFYVGNLWI